MAIFVLTTTQPTTSPLAHERGVNIGYCTTANAKSGRNMTIPYSGKFSYGANFRMLHPLCENKNCKILNMRNLFFHA